MEPCPYRQGEVSRNRSYPDGTRMTPQWSPALIGRESRRADDELARVWDAAMEPCPYRQGELQTDP